MELIHFITIIENYSLPFETTQVDSTVLAYQACRCVSPARMYALSVSIIGLQFWILFIRDDYNLETVKLLNK